MTPASNGGSIRCWLRLHKWETIGWEYRYGSARHVRCKRCGKECYLIWVA